MPEEFEDTNGARAFSGGKRVTTAEGRSYSNRDQILVFGFNRFYVNGVSVDLAVINDSMSLLGLRVIVNGRMLINPRLHKEKLKEPTDNWRRLCFGRSMLFLGHM